MKKLLLVVSIILIHSGIITAQEEWEKVKINDIASAVGGEAAFIENTPVIDGKLDDNLQSLPVRPFCLVWKTKQDNPAPINFRIAYGTAFLYLYVEAEAGHLTFRDRAYQNGDGFVVTIAKPKSGNAPADEFYDLACSAVNKPELEWSRRIFWNFNVDKIFVPTSNETLLQSAEGNGKISFELLLPWKDVRPSHPWLSEGIGFNITFCKAIEPNGAIYYQLVEEELRSLTKRNYALLKFENPEIKAQPQLYVNYKNGHLFEDDNMHADLIVLASDNGSDRINFSISGNNEKDLNQVEKEIAFKKGISIIPVEIPVSVKHGSGYSINYRSAFNNNISGSQNLTVFPKFSREETGEIIKKHKANLAESSISTIQFLSDEADIKLNKLKEYESGRDEYMNLANMSVYLDSVKAGKDPLLYRQGYLRKAFISKIDNTMQPYVVVLPVNFDRAKKYKMVVYLHGSESDETNLPEFVIPEGYIALSPFGRGTSNAFTRDHAQEDIAEAIEAVQKDYPVDETGILLTGFSMGGYGVCRTFFETPKKFRAIAIFSGGPSMGKSYANGQPAPDFMQEENLECFKRVPIFIFHGEKDRNVSFQLTKEFIGKLEKAGAKVRCEFDSEEGHSAPTKSSRDVYLEWVKNVMD